MMGMISFGVVELGRGHWLERVEEPAPKLTKPFELTKKVSGTLHRRER